MPCAQAAAQGYATEMLICPLCHKRMADADFDTHVDMCAGQKLEHDDQRASDPESVRPPLARTLTHFWATTQIQRYLLAAGPLIFEPLVRADSARSRGDSRS
jgi:hypothetical protein